MLFARSASNSCRGIYATAIPTTGAWAGYFNTSVGTAMAYDSNNNSYSIFATSSTFIGVAKVDSNGNFIYEKQFSIGTNVSVQNAVVNGAFLYISAVYGATGSRVGAIVKFNTSDGTIVWTKSMTASQSLTTLSLAYDSVNSRIYLVDNRSSRFNIRTLDDNGTSFANGATISGAGTSIGSVESYNGYLYLFSSSTIHRVLIGSNGLISSSNSFSYAPTTGTGSFPRWFISGSYIWQAYAYTPPGGSPILALRKIDPSSLIVSVSKFLGNAGSSNPIPRGLTTDASSVYVTTNSSTAGANAIRLVKVNVNTFDGVATTNLNSLTTITPSYLNLSASNLVFGYSNNLWALPSNLTIPGTGAYNIGGVNYVYTTVTPPAQEVDVPITRTTVSITTGSVTSAVTNLSPTVSTRIDTYTRTGL
jgi:hypothetical protein